jgi:methyl-accepting chemotaxis protein
MTAWTNIRFTIGRKIYFIIALSFVCFGAVTFYEMEEFGRGLRQQKQTELGHLADLALAVIKEEQAAADKAGQPVAEAQARAAARLRQWRYGSGDYFWIQDMQPRMVMHPTTPDLEGKDLSQIKDASGGHFFVAFVETVKRNGRGVVEYEYIKPGQTLPQPKMSYVVGYAPWGWVIGTGVYIDDLKAQTWEATRSALVITGFVILFVALIAVVIARGVAKAMAAMTSAMRELAAGRLDVVLPGLGRKDEVGEIAQAVEEFKLKAVDKAEREAKEREERERAAAEARRRAEEHEAQERKAADERQEAAAKDAMHKVVANFQTTIGGVIETVASAATELEASASTLTAAADATQQRSNAVAAASEQASANVQSVASAAEELSASLHEINAQVALSSNIAREAVAQAQKTDQRVNDLSQAASRIGDVVKLITAIAEQTNLLALNATIEAARAGEAGRGFAVVAQEVKALASQTAKATGEIGAQIAGMQTATQESVMAIKEIGATIGRISDISAAIADAVNEQGAATGEIARNVDQAAKGTTEVSANITEVSQHANETGAASTQMLGAARGLARDGNRLKVEMEAFLQTIRTGIGNRRKRDDPDFKGPDRRTGAAGEARGRTGT